MHPPVEGEDDPEADGLAVADELDEPPDGVADEVDPSDVVYVVGVYAPLQLPEQEAGNPKL